MNISSSASVDLTGEPIVDHHTHPIADRPIEDQHFHPFESDPAQLTGLELLQCFSLGGFVPNFLETHGHTVDAVERARLECSAENTLLAAFALRELARYFACDEDADAIAAARRERAQDYGAHVRALMAEARIDTLVVDNGWPQPPIALETMRDHLAPTRVQAIYRIEPPLEALVAEENSFGEAVDRFEAAARNAITADGYVGFKSIIAYRTGLQIQRSSAREAERALAVYRSDGNSDALKPYRDHLFVRTMQLARELNVPIHVHVGIGDNDIKMGQSMPHHLFDLLADSELRHTKFVLIHAGYPWLQEGAFLANVLPNVYVDISLSCPATGGALRENLLRVLEIAPFNKVLYGSDGLTIPEISWASAHLIRRALSETLSSLVDRGYISAPRAVAAGRRILWRNAFELYGLE